MEFSSELISYVGIGILAGLGAGLLGMSGGVITIPLLVLVFHLMNMPPEMIMHLAIGTSLAAMAFNSFASMMAHNKREAVLWDVLKGFLIGIFFGAVLGSLIARNLTSNTLQYIFGGFESLVGLYFFFYRPKAVKDVHTLPRFFGKNCLGFCISTISTMLGLGGGFITVPILLYFHVPMKKAVGTSSGTSFFITLIGALSYLTVGWKQHDFRDTVGYMYLPALITLACATLIAAPWGAYFAHKLPTLILRKIFAVALFAAGFLMIFT